MRKTRKTTLTFTISQTSSLLTVSATNKLVAFRGRRETRVQDDEEPENERDDAGGVERVRWLVGHNGRERGGVGHDRTGSGCRRVLAVLDDAEETWVARAVAVVGHGRPGQVHDVERDERRLQDT